MAQQAFHGLNETNSAWVKETLGGAVAGAAAGTLTAPAHMRAKSWIPVAIMAFRPGAGAVGARTMTALPIAGIVSYVETTGVLTFTNGGTALAAGDIVVVEFLGHQNL
jgi:hypothetical protein